MAESGKPKKPRVNMARAWDEARSLIWKHRRSLSIGLALMLVNRLAVPDLSGWRVEEGDDAFLSENPIVRVPDWA